MSSDENNNTWSDFATARIRQIQGSEPVGPLERACEAFELEICKMFFETALLPNTAARKTTRFLQQAKVAQKRLEETLVELGQNETEVPIAVSFRTLNGVKQAIQMAGGLKGRDTEEVFSTNDSGKTIEGIIELCFAECDIEQCETRLGEMGDGNMLG